MADQDVAAPGPHMLVRAQRQPRKTLEHCLTGGRRDNDVTAVDSAEHVLLPPQILRVAVLPCRQELVPVVGDGGCAGEVRLDHLHEPRFVRRDAVPVEKPLKIREQEAVLAS